MKRILTVALIVVAGFSSNLANAAQIPQSFINSVVALGGERIVTGPDGQQALQANGQPAHQWFTEGTGFLYGYLVENDPDVTKRKYEIYLVTARHVVREHVANNTQLTVRLNATDPTKGIEEFAIPNQNPDGKPTWFYHPNPAIDLAVLRVNFNMLQEKGYAPDWFPNDRSVAGSAKLKELEVMAGDDVFVLGFPMNLAGIQKNYVIVRQGVIARISEMLDHASSTFMIDSLVFPGNSGGPVVLRPVVGAITGTHAQNEAFLIGVVLSYRPYEEAAISPQTGRARILFQENSGLADILPIDYIDEAIRLHRESDLNSAPGKSTK